MSATAASVPVFTPTGDGWIHFQGTSLSTPLWAALIALTDQQLQQDGERRIGVNELHEVLYRGDVGNGLDDISPQGWDWATGLGSPKSGIVSALAGAIEQYRHEPDGHVSKRSRSSTVSRRRMRRASPSATSTTAGRGTPLYVEPSASV